MGGRATPSVQRKVLNKKILNHMKKKNVNKAGKDQGTGGKACWAGYKRVGANGCTKMKKRGKK